MQQFQRQIRHRRLRSRVKGTTARPRVSVFRSATRISVQLVDDSTHHTLTAIGGVAKKKQTKTEQAREVGLAMAAAAKAAGVSQVVFDRGGYKYHGRVKVLADALREGGLDF